MKKSLKIAVAGVIVIVVVGYCAVVLWHTYMPSGDVWTNDAQVAAHYTMVAPRVSGQTTKVLVTDNEKVQKGQLLVKIDPAPDEAALAAANAAVDTAKASLAQAKARLAEQPAVIARAKANLEKAKHQAHFQQLNAKRYHRLARSNAGTVEKEQRQNMAAQTAVNQRAADKAALNQAEKQLHVLQSQKRAARADLESARSKRQTAKLNLSYTKIRAPIAGVVGELSVHTGDWIKPGGAVMAVVPLHAIYVTAKYRETELTDISRGQPVTIKVDAYPSMTLRGRVASLAPATGVTFSPVAPENASGNFTKVEQRLPVKIRIDPDQDELARLKVGLSVETTVHIGSNHEPSGSRDAGKEIQ